MGYARKAYDKAKARKAAYRKGKPPAKNRTEYDPKWLAVRAALKDYREAA